MKADIKASIGERAHALGFDDWKVTTAAEPRSADDFRKWLAAAHHGEMQWMERNAAKRMDLQQVLPGARSVIVLATSYARLWINTDGQTKGTGVVARYAQYDDYHPIIGERLKALAEEVNTLGGTGTRSLWYVDTGPILERDLAQRAGLGFAGKHTNLISRRLGNWFFLGEILSTLALEPDPAERNRCGTCTRCITACPTEAIVAPFQLDARKCISYLTIELKGSIPEALRPAIGNRIFGCDDCLAACPWNKFAQTGAMMKDYWRAELRTPELLDLLQLDDTRFKARFANSPIQRTKRRGFLRNVCVALGNSRDKTALPALERASRDPEPLIAEHAHWAIARLEGK